MEFTAPSSPSKLGVQIKNLNIGTTLSDKHIQSIRHQWVTYGVAIFPNQKLTLEQYENFSQFFGSFGEEPFLIPMQDHPHIVKLHRKPEEEAAHFQGPGIQIGHFNIRLPQQLCSTQKLFLQ